MQENQKRIGIDCRMINESGIGRYIENILINLNHIDRVNTYYLLVYSIKDFKLNLNDNFILVEAPYKWHGFREQFLLLFKLNSLNLDLYHSPHPNMPYLYSKNFIITIHDLTMLKQKTGRASTYFYPFYILKWFVFKLMLTYAIKNAQKIITVSDFVKKQISSEFKIDTTKIEVIYNGIADTLKDSEDLMGVNETSKIVGINKPYFFYVGNAYPHKNLERLILAFELFNKEGLYELVLAGKEDFFYQRLKKEFKNVKNIIFAGYLPDNVLSSLYKNCEVYVYPSISEGFGIQIIEALRFGSKILCSDNSSFPEIAGKYAIYFNPFDIEDICKGMSTALTSKNRFSQQEIDKYLKKFDWKISAHKHYEIYQKN